MPNVTTHSLKSLTPLGANTAKTDQIGTILIAEVTDVALASVSTRIGQSKPFATAAKKLFGALPPGPGLWSKSGDYTMIWTGPEQWFVEAPFASHEDIARIVKTSLADTASVTEQTDGWVRFDVSGASVVDLLERLCPLPVRRMQTGAASRSIVEHMGTNVICRETAQHFSLLAPRSYAASLHHALSLAAKSLL